MPRSCEIKKLIGMLVLCFGAGIFMSYILPWRLLAFIEAAALLCTGVMLIK